MTTIPKPSKRGPAIKRRIARKTRPRSQRAGVLAAERREMDKLWAKIVTARATCQHCNLPGKPLDAAHVFARRFTGTRWDPANGVALHRACHDLLGSVNVWDGSQMSTWFRRAYGEGLYARLKAQARAGVNPITAEMLRTVAKEMGL